MALKDLGYFLALAIDVACIFYILFRGNRPDAKDKNQGGSF